MPIGNDGAQIELYVTTKGCTEYDSGIFIVLGAHPADRCLEILMMPAAASIRTAGAAPGPSKDPIFFRVTSATAPAIDFPLAATDSSVFLNHDI